MEEIGMKAKILAEGSESGEKVFAVVFEKGEEVVEGLTSFVGDRFLTGGHFTAIGAFRDVVLGYFDRDRKEYKRIPLSEQVEVLDLSGDIALGETLPRIHAHVVVGKSDGTAWGGHLLEAHVWPTLEVVIHESSNYLKRVYDPETGLALIDISA
jgi:uncharacterized protein